MSGAAWLLLKQHKRDAALAAEDPPTTRCYLCSASAPCPCIEVPRKERLLIEACDRAWEKNRHGY